MHDRHGNNTIDSGCRYFLAMRSRWLQPFRSRHAKAKSMQLQKPPNSNAQRTTGERKEHLFMVAPSFAPNGLFRINRSPPNTTRNLLDLNSSHDPLENVFSFFQRRRKLFDVFWSAGFHGEVDRGVAEVHPEICAIIGGGHDIRAQLRKHAG